MTQTQTIEQKIVTAAVLGTIAFKEGRQAIPCLDPALTDLLRGSQVGEGIPVLKAWTHSWHSANLAQEIAV